MACSKAFGETAVTSTPWAPPTSFRAKLPREVQLGVVDVDGDHIEAHGLGILHRQVAEAADARDHHPVVRPGVGDLEPFVNGHAGAEDRRDLDKADVGGQVTDIVGIGNDIFGEAAVHRIAGVLLLLAQGLPAAHTVLAMATGGVKPGHADPVAFLHVPHACADGDDMAHALMARDERRLGLERPVAVGGVEVGVADAGRRYLDEDLSWAGRRHGDFFDCQRLAELMDDGCHHAFGH